MLSLIMLRTLLGALKRHKRFLPPVIITLTLVVFVYFFATHPRIRHALTATSPWTLLEVGALYAAFILCLAWVYDATLRLCGRQLPAKENILLTSYSTIANFFGPLQSGPGVRAAYLRQKHHVKLGDYTLATLFYYACYAVISAAFILIGSGHLWPLATLLVAGVAVGSFGIVWLARKKLRAKNADSTLDFSPRLVVTLFAATIVQLSLVALIFFVELQAVGAHPHVTQVIAYGGAANFALFVSLTPGAIGFREAFLTFSQQVHHINTAHILAASVIDRAVFVVFLGLMFLLTLAFHANKRFQDLKPPKDQSL